MSKIIFNTFVDLSTVDNPSNGYLVAYDMDGILKQKDKNGIISSIGLSPSLSQVLAINNSTVTYDIIMGTGTYIKSEDMDSFLEVSNNYSALTAKNYHMGIELYDTFIDKSTNIWSTSTSSIVNIGVSRLYYPTYDRYQDISIYENTTSVFVSDYDRHAIFIGTRNSSFNAGITNSVIIGGYNMIATQSNTVYLGNNVNINNQYTLPSTDGISNQVLKTDGNGNVIWSDSIERYVATYSFIGGVTQSFNHGLNKYETMISIWDYDGNYIIGSYKQTSLNDIDIQISTSVDARIIII